MTRFGVEEEFQLLDEDTLVPVPLGSAARSALPSGAGEVSKEFLTSQIEFSTSPSETLQDAAAELLAFRFALGAFAREHRAVALGTGAPFGAGPAESVSPSERYETVARWLGHIVDGHHVNGLHVHVELPDDDDARVRALNAIRPWMPTLLALSGNSPFADARDTGHDSWRTIVMRRLPLAGAPPRFRDIDHYRSTVDDLVSRRVIPDAASVSWAARISDSYPTVELRIFDAQLDVEDSLLLAALTRALIDTAPPEARAQDGDEIQSSLWAAASRGLDATIQHPQTNEPLAARDAVELLHRAVAPALQASGDLDFATAGLERLLRFGTGAARQRAAYAADGISGLRSLSEGAKPRMVTETGEPEGFPSQATA